MNKSDLTKITSLLNRSNKAGLKIHYNESGLLLKYPKGQAIDPIILNELKSNREALIRYFQGLYSDKSFQQFQENHFPIIKVRQEGDDYYEVTPIQRSWLDDSKDREYKQADKVHGRVIITYEITGNFDVAIFKKSICYLVLRHESLRTTFHKLSGKYYMKIHSPLSFIPEYIDLSRVAADDLKVKQLYNFENHEFDLEKGPIFLARLIRLQENKYVLSIKVHHVVFDTISEQILLRDLYVAYLAFKENLQPDLPVLQSQYKENLAIINHFSKTYANEHRAYWNSLYSNLPEKIHLPGAKEKERKITDRILKREYFEFSTELTKKLKSLAIEFSASLFVILQAAFKAFIFSSTGNNDILIGTDIFGREFQSCKDQIGCYGRMVFIRTIFDTGDSFSDAILKVKKSNEDMQDYKAHTLMQSLGEKLAPGERLYKFWNFNLHFDDSSTTSYSRSDLLKMSMQADFTVSPIARPGNLLIPIGMVIKFHNAEDGIKFSVEYDSSLYTKSMVENFIKGYIRHTHSVIVAIDSPLINHTARHNHVAF